LAAGGFATPQADVHSAVDTLEESHRLESAKACLLRLERIWPHGKPLDDELPHTIDRFEVISELGRGGFGIVYLARDAKMGRLVALKVQRPETLLSASLRQRFVREARAAARLSHPHIAGVYEVGEAGLRVWIASEYVADGSLSSWLRDCQEPVAPKAAARLLSDLADALTCAHRLGVLHRDLKPSNVLLQRSAESERAPGTDDSPRSTSGSAPGTSAAELCAFAPKLIDFGLAKLDEGTRHETRTGALIGTPPYMAPEQAAGQTQQIGPATDVYGLGTILYELVTGRPPFRGENDVQTLRQVLDDDPPHPRKLRPDVPADLAAITLKCLEKQPAARYASTAELAADLQRFLTDRPTIARPLSIPQRVAKWSRRRPAMAALVAVSVLAAVTFVAVNAVYIRQLRQSTKTAESLRRAAEASATAATEQEDLAQRYLYTSRMRLADELLNNGDGARAAQLLENYVPPSTQAHRRGFEWYYLRKRLHPEQLTLQAHQGQTYGVAYSPDGRTLASGGQDGLVKLWEVATGRELGTLSSHKACVNCVAFSPDGQLLASVGCDQLLKLWDPATQAIIGTLEGPTGEIHSLAFSPDGKLLATGGHVGVTCVWDVANQEILATCQSVSSNIDYLGWIDDRSLIFANQMPQAEHPVQVLWNFETDERRYLPYEGSSLSISQDRRNVVLGTQYGGIHSVPELSNVNVSVPNIADRSASVSLSPSGTWLASSYFGGSIRIWDWPSMVCRQVWSSNGARPQTVTFSPKSDQLASAHWDGTVKLWSLALETSPKLQTTMLAAYSNDDRHRMAISDDFRFLAVPAKRDEVTVFDVASGRTLATLPTTDHASTLRFDERDAEVLYGLIPEHGTIWKCRWRTGQMETIGTVRHTPAEPHHIAPRGDQIFAMEHEPNWKFLIVDLTDGNRWWERPLRHALNAFAASPSGQVIALTQSRAPNHLEHIYAEVVDLTHRTVRQVGNAKVVAVTNDGNWIACVSAPTELSIRETDSQHEICRINLEHPAAFAVFTPDAKTIATCGDNRIQLWNLPTGNLVGQLEIKGWGLERIWFSKDGRQLAAAAFKDPPQSAGTNGFHQIQLFVFTASDEP
jgi:serine/threonine protein kinase/WD40 repeat protein